MSVCSGFFRMSSLQMSIAVSDGVILFSCSSVQNVHLTLYISRTAEIQQCSSSKMPLSETWAFVRIEFLSWNQHFSRRFAYVDCQAGECHLNRKGDRKDACSFTRSQLSDRCYSNLATLGLAKILEKMSRKLVPFTQILIRTTTHAVKVLHVRVNVLVFTKSHQNAIRVDSLLFPGRSSLFLDIFLCVRALKICWSHWMEVPRTLLNVWAGKAKKAPQEVASNLVIELEDQFCDAPQITVAYANCEDLVHWQPCVSAKITR